MDEFESGLAEELREKYDGAVEALRQCMCKAHATVAYSKPPHEWAAAEVFAQAAEALSFIERFKPRKGTDGP